MILSFSDGTTFFPGLACVVAAAAGLCFFRHRWIRAGSSVGAAIGLILVLLSATPLPLWAYFVWLILTVCAWAIFGRRGISRRTKTGLFVALSLISAGFFLAELPYRADVDFPVPEGATIYVLGDSISAGMGMAEIPWPVVLDETTSYRIVNLAIAGAKVGNALGQAERIPGSGAHVIVEIGGNDLLGRTPAEDFAVGLERLISSLDGAGHRILLFELPLIPFHNRFGRVQREIASRYGVSLIPKRYFTKVLGMKGGTLDGLHLSQDGHDAMAATVAGILAEAEK